LFIISFLKFIYTQGIVNNTIIYILIMMYPTYNIKKNKLFKVCVYSSSPQLFSFEKYRLWPYKSQSIITPSTIIILNTSYMNIWFLFLFIRSNLKRLHKPLIASNMKNIYIHSIIGIPHLIVFFVTGLTVQWYKIDITIIRPIKSVMKSYIILFFLAYVNSILIYPNYISMPPA
jgi:hypothetical protein